jgi:hypothetical protein
MRRFQPAHPNTMGADNAPHVAPEQHPDFKFAVGEPFGSGSYSNVRCHMTQAQHYQFQADQAKRLARQVTNSELREKLLEMAGEYSRYAQLMEARERPIGRALG